MENKKIQKIYNLGNNVIVSVSITPVSINESIAIMSCNYGKELIKIYFMARKNGKDVFFNKRTNTMIEKFDIPISEYEKKLDADYKTALIEQKKAIDFSKELIKKKK
jgi:hypothetical protein